MLLKFNELFQSQVEPALNAFSNSVAEAQTCLLMVNYSISKGITSLSKLFLGSRLKCEVQSELAGAAAAFGQLNSKDEILKKIVAFALLQIGFLTETSVEGQLAVLKSRTFEQCLKIISNLTFFKPQVDRSTNSLRIKTYLSLDFETMLQLKDYLKLQLTLEKAVLTDFKSQRMVLKSLTTIMCEFDSLSNKFEVLDDVFGVVQQSFTSLIEAKNSGMI